jgi:hypothetical protein
MGAHPQSKVKEANHMTYEELQKANADIKTTNIKGKEYAEVPERVTAFRKVCPNGAIETEYTLNGNICICKATIKDNEGKTLATGIAYEKEGSNYINKTSYIENAETSAVGRALGFAGFGIAASIASADEVMHAIEQQEVEKKKKQKISDIDAKSLHDRCGGNKDLEGFLLNAMGVKRFEDMTYERYGILVQNWDAYVSKYEAK